MKRLVFMAVMLLAAGCRNDLENASSNMKKGDEFFDSKDYDVAEYYYQRVPPESPLYIAAAAKLDSIAAFRRYWSATTATEDDLAKIQITDNSASMTNAKMMPMHSFVIVNNTARTLASVTVEFTYFDMNRQPVGTLTCEVDAPLPPKQKGVFSRVEPGTLGHGFMKSQARIVGAAF